MGKHHEDLRALIAPFLPDGVEEGPHSKLSGEPSKHLCVPDWLVGPGLDSSVVLPPVF